LIPASFFIFLRSHLRAEELYLIALAIDVEPCELLEALYGGLKLKTN